MTPLLSLRDEAGDRPETELRIKKDILTQVENKIFEKWDFGFVILLQIVIVTNEELYAEIRDTQLK